ncbi:MAG: glycosyltransferase [Candidatus Daviesbacteria bacterium]|nr:glycosyltransferase [Candidatus Daviesbacteria bacterium]
MDSFGGGERYILTVAELLSSNNQVDLLLDSHLQLLITEDMKNDLGKRFNLNLSEVKLVKAPLGRGKGFLSKFFFLRKYDLVFFLTDGSIFYSTAKRNIIHFQVPFKNTVARSLWGRIKLSSWNLAVCNSKFTQSVIEKDWPIKSQVIYPPVDVEAIKPLNKKKQILSVGRFASFSKLKKHEMMIKAFKELHQEKKISGWSLHLVGSIEGDNGYIEELKELAKGLPIKFYPNLSFTGLVKLYGESSIYWHAAGFGEDNPALMEHFGIATVEAMAGGCVPIVINSGGQVEIVENELSGYLWNQINELKGFTTTLVKDNSLLVKLSANAVKRSKVFSKKFFQDNLLKLVKSLDE